MQHQRPSQINILKKINILGQNEGSVEFLHVIKILNISSFDGALHHKKILINFLKLGCSQILEHYCFWNLEAIGK